MPRDKQQLKKINSSEVLPGDTVLLLCSDNDIRIQIEGVFENDGTSKELDVTLFVVDYDELVVKNKTIRVSGLSLEFRNGPPTFVPPGYKHYELGSNFSYEVTLKDLPASSSLTFRVFGSVADASFYASDSTDIAARNKAIFNQQVTANTSSSIHFERDYASYFITMFDPKSSVGGFKMECSYSVLQTYYKNTDYLPYTEHCRLNSTEEPCYFDFSNKTQMCVLAYNPSSGSTETNPVLLTTSTFTNAKTQLVHPNIFFVSLAVVVIHVLISLCVMVICLCVICFRKCSKCYPYHLIPNTNSI